MVSIKDGHLYHLLDFESNVPMQKIQFIEKETVDGELRLVNDGTTNEEVLKVLIHRIQTLNKLFPCRENAIVITKLQEALMWCEERTRDRTERGVIGKHQK
jgi:hypothetical protein